VFDSEALGRLQRWDSYGNPRIPFSFFCFEKYFFKLGYELRKRYTVEKSAIQMASFADAALGDQ
jgi:hypothetical protein